MRKKFGRIMIVLTIGLLLFCICPALVLAENETSEVRSIRFASKNITLALNRTSRLVAYVNPISMAGQLRFSSANPDVVSITESGYMTGKSEGQAVITATAGGVSKSISVKVRVNSVESVKLKRTKLTLNPGEQYVMASSVRPSSASYPKLEWYSTNPAVATVEDGRIAAHQLGSAIIFATSNNGKTASCKLTVKNLTVKSLSLSSNTGSVAAGSQLQMKAIVRPANAADGQLEWSSSNPDVASVDAQTGLVRALKPGKATITVTTVTGTKHASCKITVKNQPVRRVRLSSTRTQLALGKSTQLTATISPADATDRSLSWSSSDESVVSVSKNGTLTPHAAGSALITCSASNGRRAVCSVTVTEATSATYRLLMLSSFNTPSSEGYLPFVENTTDGMSTLFSASGVDGSRYQVTHVSRLRSDANAIKAIRNAFADAQDNDVSVLYIASHGQDRYLRLQDSKNKLTYATILRALRNVKGNIVLVVPACRSGGALSLLTQEIAGKNLLGRLSVVTAVQSSLSAARVSKDFAPDESYDFFTYALLKGLGYDLLSDTFISRQADSNSDGAVTLKELRDYINAQVPKDILSLSVYDKKYFRGSTAQRVQSRLVNGDLVLVN